MKLYFSNQTFQSSVQLRLCAEVHDPIYRQREDDSREEAESSEKLLGGGLRGGGLKSEVRRV